MQTGLATTDVAGTAVSLPAEIRERMQSMLASRVRPTRGKAYRNDWRVWERWAVEYGASALLSAMSARRKLSTLRRYLTSISVMHSLQRHQFETGSPAIRTIMKGIRREKGSDRRKAKPLMPKRVRSSWRALSRR